MNHAIIKIYNCVYDPNIIRVLKASHKMHMIVAFLSVYKTNERRKKHRKKTLEEKQIEKNNSEFLLCRRSMRTHFSIYMKYEIYESQKQWMG